MSAVGSEIDPSKARVGSRPGARSVSLRKTRLRSLALEGLEERALMAVLPPSQALATSLVGSFGDTGNASTPSIAVDPNHPNILVAAWTLNDPTFAPGPTEVVRYAFSFDSGASWSNQGQPGNFLTDPTTSPTGPDIFKAASDATVAFDHDDNAYILYSQHKGPTDNSSGALLLSRFNVSSGSATTVFRNNLVYEWVVDPALTPTLAVDSSVRNFSETDDNGNTHNQSNPYSGTVYVAWASADVAPAFLTDLTNYDGARIKMVSSSDGGNSFSGQQILNDNGSFGANRGSTPRLAVSQGGNGVAPGHVSVVWDDYGVGSQSTPKFDSIFTDRTDAGYSQQFTSGPKITPGILPLGSMDQRRKSPVAAIEPAVEPWYEV